MKPEMSTAVMIERVREMAADSADSQDHVLLTQVANRIELLLAAESGMSREMACIRHALDIPPDQSVQSGVVDAFVRLNAETSAKRWCPDYDQITGRGLFLWIEHPTLGCVPTYGGPYDSYTLPERDADGEFFVHRYDHDEGAWVDDEVLSFHVVDDWLPKNQAELDQYVKDNALTSAERERLNELLQEHDDRVDLILRNEQLRIELYDANERLAVYDRAAKEPVGDVTYFSFSPDYGFDLFKNRQDAIDTAQEEIDSYREARDDGWDDDVRRVGWGIVIQKAEGFDAQGKHHFHSEHTYQTCEYKLCPAPPLPVVQEGLHPSTSTLVIDFATALAEKLRKAELKYGYSHGWTTNDWEVECLSDFHKHIAKGDPRDVAAYCAFMWYHGWKTEAQALPVVPDELADDSGYKDSYIDGWNACRAAMLQSGGKS